ncbi:carbohydrate kinase family protein, partial [Planctomycetota bacterium]
MNVERVGVACGGNWILDRVKLIDCLPDRGMLANIRAETVSTGGSPANVLDDLSRLGAPFPLSGFGFVGDDEGGRLVQRTFDRPGIDISGIRTTEASTSYTDVMTEEHTGTRSFFHHRGANALFGPKHVAVETLTC